MRFDTGIVRGLDYYTGPVFEAQLTFPAQNEEGETVVMGSVGGGGRYDDLVARFTGQRVPASGISVGVSRLLSVLKRARHRGAGARAAHRRAGARPHRSRGKLSSWPQSCARPACAPKPMPASPA